MLFLKHDVALVAANDVDVPLIQILAFVLSWAKGERPSH